VESVDVESVTSADGSVVVDSSADEVGAETSTDVLSVDVELITSVDVELITSVDVELITSVDVELITSVDWSMVVDSSDDEAEASADVSSVDVELIEFVSCVVDSFAFSSPYTAFQKLGDIESGVMVADTRSNVARLRHRIGLACKNDMFLRKSHLEKSLMDEKITLTNTVV
jgi:hypothetical protein